MSKGNMLLGYARGKVGSLVFSRRKGEQVTRARNTHPANPRTPAQIQQRMKMYAPVQLYKSSIASQFVYAFEDQRANETAFNAFMRHNIVNAPWVSKPLASAYAPIPFPAELSAGSAPSVTAEVADVFLEPGQSTAIKWGAGVVFSTPVIDNAIIAEFSTGMLAKYPSLREGDLITFIVVRSAGLSIENGDVKYNGVDTFNFKYAQVVLDTTNSADLSSVGLSAGWSEEIPEGGGTPPNYVYLDGGDAPYNQEIFAQGGAIIVSRKVDGKVIASNSKLQLNSFGTSVYNLMRASAYRDKASVTYMATEEPLLDPDKVD